MKKNTLLIPLLFMQLAVSARGEHQQDLQRESLSFLENKGQIRDQFGTIRKDIDFSLQDKNLTLFIGKGKIEYQFIKKQENSGNSVEKEIKKGALPKPITVIGGQISIARVEVNLLQASDKATLVKEDLQKSSYNYYNQSRGDEEDILEVQTYQKITYKNIYPAIDWVLYTTEKGLKYDFIAHAGAKLSDIQLAYQGANVKILADGSLKAEGPLGSITEDAPYSYEVQGHKKISSKYILKNNVVSFKTANYKGSLVIDPGVSWATYYGGEKDESSDCLATDKNGNVYVSGITQSVSHIATTGAHQTSLSASSVDAFLSKFDSLGKLQWSTYYGGDNFESNTSVSCDNFGNVYLGGATQSTNRISTSGSFQPTFPTGTGSVGFLVKFSDQGTRKWATYYGGKATVNSRISAITCTKDGFVYIGGSCDSTTGATATAHQTLFGGGREDGFLAKFDSSGKRQWATFYGGAGADGINSVLLDDSNNIYCAGATFMYRSPDRVLFYSTTGIATNDTHISTYTDYRDGGFLVKFNANGQRQWGTYLRSSSASPAKLAIDNFKHLYVCGMDQSLNDTLIASPGSYQPVAQNNQSNAFLLQFNREKGTRNWGTYYGAELFTSGTSVACDLDGSVFIAGTSNCLGDGVATIATTGSHQDALSLPDTFSGYNPPSDAFIAQFDSTGQRKWATYFGGPKQENGNALAISSSGALYLSGSTLSDNGIATRGAYQTTYNGASSATSVFGDIFLVRLLPVDIALTRQTLPPGDTACSGSIPLSVQIKNQGRIDKLDTLNISYHYTGPTSGQLDTFFTGNLPAASSKDYDLGHLDLSVPGDYKTTVYLRYTRDDNTRKNDTLQFQLTITNALPKAEIEVNNIGSVFHFSNNKPIPSDSYSWDFGDGKTSRDANPSHEYTLTEEYEVTLIVTGFCGSDTARKTIQGIGSNGIAETALSKQITIYPNPSDQYLYIHTTTNNPLTSYCILNALGQTVQSGPLNDKEMLSIGTLSSGTYLLRIQSGKNTVNKKFQVIRH